MPLWDPLNREAEPLVARCHRPVQARPNVHRFLDPYVRYSRTGAVRLSDYEIPITNKKIEKQERSDFETLQLNTHRQIRAREMRAMNCSTGLEQTMRRASK